MKYKTYDIGDQLQIDIYSEMQEKIDEYIISKNHLDLISRAIAFHQSSLKKDKEIKFRVQTANEIDVYKRRK